MNNQKSWINTEIPRYGRWWSHLTINWTLVIISYFKQELLLWNDANILLLREQKCKGKCEVMVKQAVIHRPHLKANMNGHSWRWSINPAFIKSGDVQWTIQMCITTHAFGQSFLNGDKNNCGRNFKEKFKSFLLCHLGLSLQEAGMFVGLRFQKSYRSWPRLPTHWKRWCEMYI